MHGPWSAWQPNPVFLTNSSFTSQVIFPLSFFYLRANLPHGGPFPFEMGFVFSLLAGSQFFDGLLEHSYFLLVSHFCDLLHLCYIFAQYLRIGKLKNSTIVRSERSKLWMSRREEIAHRVKCMQFKQEDWVRIPCTIVKSPPTTTHIFSPNPGTELEIGKGVEVSGQLVQPISRTSGSERDSFSKY